MTGSSATGSDGRLRVESEGGILTVTIDRPGTKNALTVAMRQHLEQLCREADEDQGVDVMVLAAVDPVFCAGADIKEIVRLAADLPQTNPGAALRDMTTPVIAAVNGSCVSGGLEIALSCDLIIASDRALFADTHARLGVLPRWGMSALLPRAVGPRRAKEMTATGGFVGAEEALRIGLVNHLVPHEELGHQARSLAVAMAAGEREAVRATFALYDEGTGRPLAEALAMEVDRASTRTLDAEDFLGRHTAT